MGMPILPDYSFEICLFWLINNWGLDIRPTDYRSTDLSNIFKKLSKIKCSGKKMLTEINELLVRNGLAFPQSLKNFFFMKNADQLKYKIKTFAMNFVKIKFLQFFFFFFFFKVVGSFVGLVDEDKLDSFIRKLL